MTPRLLPRLTALMLLLSAVPALADDAPPVIGPGDTGIGEIVREGPGEPEAAGMMAPDEAFGAAEPFAFTESEGARSEARNDARPIGPAPSTPVLVELFTAQGCSSCPPADELMGALAGQPGVLALSFHVDYWDYLGWPDDFARPEFTNRQRAYALRTGERAVWTPQIVVGGSETVLDLTPDSVSRMIEADRAQMAPLTLDVDRDGPRVTVTLRATGAQPGAATVDLVRYVPRRDVTVSAGENRGRTLSYRNIVVGLDHLANWDGVRPLTLTVSLGAGASEDLPTDTAHALIVQAINGGLPGPIYAALPLD